MSVPAAKVSARRTRTAPGIPAAPWLLAMLLAPLTAGTVAAAWGEAKGTRIELLLQGLDCSLCVQALEQRLRTLPGAEQVTIDLERGRLSLQLRGGSRVADETLRTLMRNAGFVVQQIRRSPVGR